MNTARPVKPVGKKQQPPPSRPGHAEDPGRRRSRRSAKYPDPRQPLMDWLREQVQPVLRQGVRQPRLGELFRPGHRRPAGRPEPGQRPVQRRAAELPGRRVHRPRLRHAVAAPGDPQQRHLSAELEDQRDQPAGRAQLQPRRGPATARRSDARRHRHGHRHPTERLASFATSLDDRAIGPGGIGTYPARARAQQRAATATSSPSSAGPLRETNCDCERIDRPDAAADALHPQRPEPAGPDRRRRTSWIARASPQGRQDARPDTDRRRSRRRSCAP